MPFRTVDLGFVPYDEAYQIQLETLNEVLAGGDPTLLMVEHPPVLTLGASFHRENLLLSELEYLDRGISVAITDRGGDVTYHGPGQMVAYPIFPLDFIGRDLHAWLRLLEEAVIRTLVDFGIEGRRFPPHTGVWIGDAKVCAMGIKVRRWTSFHGIALNCDMDLAPFEDIVPCGIHGYGVTSMSKSLGRRVTVPEVKPRFIDALRWQVENPPGSPERSTSVRS